MKKKRINNGFRNPNVINEKELEENIKYEINKEMQNKRK